MTWAANWYKKRYFVNAVDEIVVRSKSSKVDVSVLDSSVYVKSSKSLITVTQSSDTIGVDVKKSEITT